MLRGDVAHLQAAAEHGIQRLKACWRLCDSGFVRRRSMAEAVIVWKVGAALHNRRLRLYGPQRALR